MMNTNSSVIVKKVEELLDEQLENIHGGAIDGCFGPSTLKSGVSKASGLNKKEPVDWVPVLSGGNQQE